MLRNSLKILDTNKTGLFELIFLLNEQKIWQRFCHAGLDNVSNPLKCWLCVSILTRVFFGISVTLIFAVYNLREYFSSGVNMLTNSLKILDTSKREFFELIFFLNDQKMWPKFCRADLSSVSDPSTYWMIRKPDKNSAVQI